MLQSLASQYNLSAPNYKKTPSQDTDHNYDAECPCDNCVNESQVIELMDALAGTSERDTHNHAKEILESLKELGWRKLSPKAKTAYGYIFETNAKTICTIVSLLSETPSQARIEHATGLARDSEWSFSEIIVNKY